MKYKHVKSDCKTIKKNKSFLKTLILYFFLISTMMLIFAVGVVFLYKKITLKDKLCGINADSTVSNILNGNGNDTTPFNINGSNILENNIKNSKDKSYGINTNKAESNTLNGNIQNAETFKITDSNTPENDIKNTQNGEIHRKLKTGEPLTSRDIRNYDFSEWNRNCKYEWRVVNGKNSLPEDFNVATDTVDNKVVGQILSSQLKKMIEVAKDQDLQISVCSGYRTPKYQQTLFAKEIAEVQRKNKKVTTYAEASKIAATSVARPYHSEHNAGLAVDLCRVDAWFGSTKEYEWMCKWAHKFGFILRYTKANESETGVMPEPWHWRYVGDIAEKVYKSGKSFERFVIEDMIGQRLN